MHSIGRPLLRLAKQGASSPFRRLTSIAQLLSSSLCLSLLLSCLALPTPTPSATTRTERARSLATEAGFAALPGAEAGPPIAAWLRPGDPTSPPRVYIEGDGLAFVSRRRRAEDPTPVHPTALEMAIADPHPGPTLYLGRPCQYAPDRAKDCDPLLYTVARFGEDVLAAMDARLDRALAGLAAPEGVVLVGFSGGGVVAALLAARRGDIERLVTVAAPLHVDGWTEAVGAPRLVWSQTPMDQIEVLRRVRQIHFASREDTHVPASVVAHYVDAIGKASPTRFVRVPDLDHGDWATAWPRLLRELDPKQPHPIGSLE